MSSTQTFAIVNTAIDTKEKAEKMAAEIVAAKLAACVQITPINSVYRWKGEVETANEWLVSAKTRKGLVKQLTAFIRQSHSYELPEIIATSIEDGFKDYLKWIENETIEPESSTES